APPRSVATDRRVGASVYCLSEPLEGTAAMSGPHWLAGDSSFHSLLLNGHRDGHVVCRQPAIFPPNSLFTKFDPPANMPAHLRLGPQRMWGVGADPAGDMTSPSADKEVVVEPVCSEQVADSVRR